MYISICIPTFNRAHHLQNCLQSIIENKIHLSCKFQICVSDNCSSDNTEQIVNIAKESLKIKYERKEKNIGRVRNYLSVVKMAEGEFVWLLGDDDLLLPNGLNELYNLISRNEKNDIFYINSFHLTTDYVFSFPQPFRTKNLPEEMIPFSAKSVSGEMFFMDLIDPKVSFDFLGGMFLTVFRRKKWMENINTLDRAAIYDCREFSHFDNTFPHVKIFAKAFANSKAYFFAKPISVCLTGAREWSPMYHLVRSVRLIEALYEYRKNGLPLFKFIQCKNYALGYFIPDFISMLINREKSGFIFIKPINLIIRNILYPNFFLSFFYYFYRKFKQFVKNNQKLTQIQS